MANKSADISRNLAVNILGLRQQRGFTQARLALLAKLPRSTVTLLESGSCNPSILSLVGVADALQVSVEELLARPRARCQLYTRTQLPLHRRSRAGAALRKLLPDAIPTLEMDELILNEGASLTGSPHLAGTKEYFYCSLGEIEIEVAGELFRAQQGELLAFPGDQPHTYRNPGRKPCTGISVVAWAR